ncbi:unnamed protein product [Discosporangium mesarthrocarpum]
MCVVISIGNSVISNELLKRTKGHALGLGFVALGWGLAFFTSIIMFGHISATASGTRAYSKVNPAMILAKAFLGRLSWRDALALIMADMAGAFLGAVFVYGVYFAHFSIVPYRPEPPRWDDVFLRPRNGLPEFHRNAYISYDGDALENQGFTSSRRPEALFRFEKTPCCRPAQEGAQQMVRSHSLQVGTLLHEHDKETDSAYVSINSNQLSPPKASGDGGQEKDKDKEKLPRDEGGQRETLSHTRPGSGDGDPPGLVGGPVIHSGPGIQPTARDTQEGGNRPTTEGQAPEGGREGVAGAYERSPGGGDGRPLWRQAFERMAHILQGGGYQLTEDLGQPDGVLSGNNLGRISESKGKKTPREDKETADLSELEMMGVTKEEIAAYRGALRADQNAKLSCFASRPAVFNYWTNLVAETLCTFILIWSALMLEERKDLLDSPWTADSLAPLLEPFLIGFLVVGLVVSLAGPTGYAANPARDFGPRVAHFFLPIPNKGPSEWYYAWIPVVGPSLGGFLGAIMFWGCHHLNEYPEWYDNGGGAFGGHWDCTNLTC